MTKVKLVLEVFCALMVLGTLGLFLMPPASGPIPTHFDFTGTADSYGDTIPWQIPLGTLVLYILMTIIARYPHQFNYPYPITAQNSLRQFQNSSMMILTLKTVLLMQLMYILMVQISSGKTLGSWFIPTAILMVLSTIVFFLWRGFKLT